MPGLVMLMFKKDIVRSKRWDCPKHRKVIVDGWEREANKNWKFCELIIKIDETQPQKETWGEPRTKSFGKISRDKQRVKSIVL